jgi:hypothetical protein
MTESNEKKECVYVMSNPSYEKDVLKIGWTRKHPSERAEDLHTTSIPTGFIIEYVIVTLNGYKTEKTIHDYIKKYRINSSREFFKIPKDMLLEILTSELNLTITPIENIELEIKKKLKIHTKKIYELTSIYNPLEEDINNFLKKFQTSNKLIINKVDNKKIVMCNIPTGLASHNSSTETNWIDRWRCFGNEDESHIAIQCEFLESDLKQNKKDMNFSIEMYNSNEIYNRVRDTIGIKLLKSDHKYLIKMMMNTRKRLTDLKNEYTWNI